MLPLFCGRLALLAALPAGPSDLPPPQVISPRPRSAQEVIAEVPPAPARPEHTAAGASPTFRFVPPLVMPFGPRSGEADALTVMPEPGMAPPGAASPEAPQARTEDTRAREEPGLLARLVLSGRLGRGGVTVTWLASAGTSTQEAEVSVVKRSLYLAEALAVVAMELKLSAAATQSWVPGEAWLLDARGGVVGRFPVWMEGTRLGPGETRTMAIEMELVRGVAPGAFRLELRERDGGRTVHAGDLKPREGNDRT